MRSDIISLILALVSAATGAILILYGAQFLMAEGYKNGYLDGFQDGRRQPKTIQVKLI